MLYYRILKTCETSELCFGDGVLVTYPWYLNIPFPGGGVPGHFLGSVRGSATSAHRTTERVKSTQVSSKSPLCPPCQLSSLVYFLGYRMSEPQNAPAVTNSIKNKLRHANPDKFVSLLTHPWNTASLRLLLPLGQTTIHKWGSLRSSSSQGVNKWDTSS